MPFIKHDVTSNCADSQLNRSQIQSEHLTLCIDGALENLAID